MYLRQGESIALEDKIRSVKSIKAETLEQILETERQIMLWEKKTQLERETQVRVSLNTSRTSYGEVNPLDPNSNIAT